ncbi:hypothetical protein BC30102_4499 [Bacillus cereus]|nr:hypothetical protein BC30102_4499 [Bacillus cereus]
MKVTIDEIKSKNYNLDFKNPYSEEEELLSPAEALEKYNRSLQQVQEVKENLRQELSSILEGIK